MGSRADVTKEADPQPYDCLWMRLSHSVSNAISILGRLMKRLKSLSLKIRGKHKLSSCDFSRASQPMRSRPLLKYRVQPSSGIGPRRNCGYGADCATDIANLLMR